MGNPAFNVKDLLTVLVSFVMLLPGQPLHSQTRSTYISEMSFLKEKYNVTFIYDTSLPMNAACWSARDRISLKLSLRDLFYGSGIDYEVIGRTIILCWADKAVDYEEPPVVFDTLRPSNYDGALKDTLRAARVEADRVVNRDAGTRIVELPAIRTMVSATGESDAVKYIQTLPGVSTGGEGSSAIYVRGGNIGSNLTTLDGVSIYGGSHLLGLTSAYPTDIVSSLSFRVGGFHGDESNITASHIDVRTESGSFTKSSYSVSASTFILGGTISMPLVKNKVSLLGSVRVSPLGPAFRVVQAAAGGALDSLSRPRAVVYDAYAKVKWLIDDDNNLSLSVFSSKDAYSYRYSSSYESMGWDNLIVNAHHDGRIGRRWSIEDGVAYNHFSGRQGIIRIMGGTVNNLAVISTLDEVTADVVFSRTLGRGGDLRLGVRERFAIFNPGTSATFKGVGPLQPLDSPRTDHISHSNITTLHAQWDLSRERFELMASGKMNAYGADDPGIRKWNRSFDSEGSLLVRLNLFRWLSLEATTDRTVQYYHTLEGLPLGWNVDLLVPTNPSRPPEQARQNYAGLFLSFGQHRVTAGAYEKKMSNLVYFLDASRMFSSAITGWSHNIMVGSGTSRGVEFLYEKDGDRLDWRVAYTLSKTDRTFEGVNEGVVFPAKFDRRHILNATASFTLLDNQRCAFALTGLYTWQSGHWETVAAGEYPAVDAFNMTVFPTLDYHSGVNNYEMPPYVRLDLGCSLNLKTKHPQELTFGLYNVLNRHNPFTVFYDDRSREWRQVSLIPIMPSFSYRISL